MKTFKPFLAIVAILAMAPAFAVPPPPVVSGSSAVSGSISNSVNASASVNGNGSSYSLANSQSSSVTSSSETSTALTGGYSTELTGSTVLSGSGQAYNQSSGDYATGSASSAGTSSATVNGVSNAAGLKSGNLSNSGSLSVGQGYGDGFTITAGQNTGSFAQFDGSASYDVTGTITSVVGSVVANGSAVSAKSADASAGALTLNYALLNGGVANAVEDVNVTGIYNVTP